MVAKETKNIFKQTSNVEKKKSLEALYEKKRDVSKRWKVNKQKLKIKIKSRSLRWKLEKYMWDIDTKCSEFSWLNFFILFLFSNQCFSLHRQMDKHMLLIFFGKFLGYKLDID